MSKYPLSKPYPSAPARKRCSCLNQDCFCSMRRCFLALLCQTHAAHYSRFITVYHLWHPLFGETVAVKNTGHHGAELYYTVPTEKATSLLIPAWMTDRGICSDFKLDFPRCSLRALRSLRQLIVECSLMEPATSDKLVVTEGSEKRSSQWESRRKDSGRKNSCLKRRIYGSICPPQFGSK